MLLQSSKKNKGLAPQNAGFVPLENVRHSLMGFTIVELIVVIAIFTILSAVVMARYRDFSGGIILTNLAQEIALTTREAQVYGISVKTSGGSNFSSRYGIHLDSSINNFLIFFADENGDGRYTDSSEIIETISTSQGNVISDFCAVPNIGTPDCTVTNLDISFLRPNPDAKFCVYVAPNCVETYKEATITVFSTRTGQTRTITVRQTGQIEVTNP